MSREILWSGKTCLLLPFSVTQVDVLLALFAHFLLDDLNLEKD